METEVAMVVPDAALTNATKGHVAELATRARGELPVDPAIAKEDAVLAVVVKKHPIASAAKVATVDGRGKDLKREERRHEEVDHDQSAD